jgi:hypothetical protein
MSSSSKIRNKASMPVFTTSVPHRNGNRKFNKWARKRKKYPRWKERSKIVSVQK